MAKKTKDDAPNPSSVVNRDIIQRLSFLYQASSYLNSPAFRECSQVGHGDVRDTRKKRRKLATSDDLARTYVQSMKVAGKKTLVKMCAQCFSCNPTPQCSTYIRLSLGIQN
jgi:ribonuclease P protein subunit RPR2